MKQQWWKSSVVYQIYPRSFMDSDGDGIGDLAGITQKLDYLTELGVDMVWISPIFQSPNDDNGYDISDYRAIMPEFGTMEDFDLLLAKAHERGLKIVLDLVVNHTSDEHPWFAESRKSKDNPYRDYYIWREGKDGAPPNNWGSEFSGSAWEYDAATEMYYLHLFTKKQPDLNWDNPAMREEVYALMTWWLDKGIDGFRMDVISNISKPDGLPDGVIREGELYAGGVDASAQGPRVHKYLQEMNRRTLAGRDLITIGETARVTPEDARRYANLDGSELSMVFHFEHVGLEAVGGGRWHDNRYRLSDLKAVFNKWQTELEGVAWNSLYWENHDQPRSVSRYGNDKKYWLESAKMLATCLHFQQGTPYIYQGEELGMTNTRFETLDDCRDVEVFNGYRQMVEEQGVSPQQMFRYINHISRDHARTPMQWNDSPNAGFSTGTPWIPVNPNYTKINAAAQRNDENSVFSYYQKLIRLRREYQVIIDGHFELLDPSNEELFCYTRSSQDETLLIICSFADHGVTYHIPQGFLAGSSQLLIANYSDCSLTQQITLRPYECRVYSKR
ncbi:alpha-glucosidase [Hydrogenoanaerobacterium sp.]|uniref:glycoside hydrolase family 13 protein n=1 Tax=Hydrogenoanaerobacterium sp. TaxID=2953763 RepID=UPI00289F0732|nr:alpha-glucosidase [Hydrogenoanaerobacterium sp.]